MTLHGRSVYHLMRCRERERERERERKISKSFLIEFQFHLGAQCICIYDIVLYCYFIESVARSPSRLHSVSIPLLFFI